MTDQPHILIEGNPVDGLTFTGPFPTHGDAADAGDDAGVDWWVAPIAPPRSDDRATLTADIPPDDERLTAAVQRIVKVLQEQETPPGFTVSLVTWSLPEAGFRVAEVDWVRDDRKAGASFMQSDLPYGLAVCAQAERAIITAAFMDDEDETQTEIDRLLYLIRDAAKLTLGDLLDRLDGNGLVVTDDQLIDAALAVLKLNRLSKVDQHL